MSKKAQERPCCVLYLSGPMRGMEDFNYPAFHAAAAELRAQGHTVLNPAEAFDGDTGLKFSQYMRADLELLQQATGIVMLPGWQNSEGARLEYAIAKALGLIVKSFGGASLAEPVELQAASLVRNGARQQVYGHPAEDFKRTAKMWSALLGAEVTAKDVALMMAMLKMSRLVATPDHADSVTDLIGYTICYQRVVDYQAGNTES